MAECISLEPPKHKVFLFSLKDPLYFPVSHTNVCKHFSLQQAEFFLKKAWESKGCLSNCKSQKSRTSKANLRLLRFEVRPGEVLYQEESLRIYVKDHRGTAPAFSNCRSCTRVKSYHLQHCPPKGDVLSKLAPFKWEGLQYIAED